jgi:hypothetical protein
MRAYASLSPPTMIVSVPACTWGTLPDTGASTMVAPKLSVDGWQELLTLMEARVACALVPALFRVTRLGALFSVPEVG